MQRKWTAGTVIFTWLFIIVSAGSLVFWAIVLFRGLAAFRFLPQIYGYAHVFYQIIYGLVGIWCGVKILTNRMWAARLMVIIAFWGVITAILAIPVDNEALLISGMDLVHKDAAAGQKIGAGMTLATGYGLVTIYILFLSMVWRAFVIIFLLFFSLFFARISRGIVSYGR